MNVEFQQFLPEDFAPESRVWIYQSNRLLMMSEAFDLEPMLDSFLAEWRSHGAKVKCWGNLLFGQFLVLAADETQAGVSGCSTDSSVRFVKTVGEKFKVDFFNRTHLAFFVKEKIQTISMAQLQPALNAGLITADTPYLNNTVLTLGEMRDKWVIPVKDSWIAGRFALA